MRGRAARKPGQKRSGCPPPLPSPCRGSNDRYSKALWKHEARPQPEKPAFPPRIYRWPGRTNTPCIPWPRPLQIPPRSNPSPISLDRLALSQLVSDARWRISSGIRWRLTRLDSSAISKKERKVFLFFYGCVPTCFWSFLYTESISGSGESSIEENGNFYLGRGSLQVFGLFNPLIYNIESYSWYKLRSRFERKSKLQTYEISNLKFQI